MPVFDQHITISVKKVIGETARLGAGTTVGTAVADILAQIALPAVADTQGTMDEKFQRHGGLLPNLANLFKAQLATQNNLTKPQLFKELYLFHAQVVALRAGMKRDGRQVELQELHILHDQCIDTDVPAVVNQLSCALYLIFI